MNDGTWRPLRAIYYEVERIARETHDNTIFPEANEVAIRILDALYTTPFTNQNGEPVVLKESSCTG